MPFTRSLPLAFPLRFVITPLLSTKYLFLHVSPPHFLPTFFVFAFFGKLDDVVDVVVDVGVVDGDVGLEEILDSFEHGRMFGSISAV